MVKLKKLSFFGQNFRVFEPNTCSGLVLNVDVVVKAVKGLSEKSLIQEMFKKVICYISLVESFI